MCGICGIFRLDQAPVHEVELRAMAEKMLLRGPDAEGFYCNHNVGLGFRRLAIIDLLSGNQPLTNEDRSIWLVMNGEIYNYIELRKELKSKGHMFSTKSDAEVIIHLYEEHGNDFVLHLNGMFSFALYDQSRDKLLLGRDRLGIKPLYYKFSGKTLYFGSDARSLSNEASPNLSELSFLTYLSLGYSSQDSIFEGVIKLPPANLLEICGRQHRLISYWNVADHSFHDQIQQLDQGQLEEVLENAVRLQLRSDVPLGVFLSGGIDSSAVVALASEALDTPVNTYSVEYTEKNGKDPYFAELVSRHYNTRHTKLVLSADLAERYLDSLLYRLDEPMADSAILATYALAKRAREDGVKVLLSGAGGDEIFGGYQRHLRPKLYSRLWMRDKFFGFDNSFLKFFLKAVHPGLHERMKHEALNYFSQISGADYSVVSQLLNKDQYQKVVNFLASEYESIPRDAPIIGYEYARMRNDLHGYLVNNVLALTDKATMAASVEARVPLIDHQVVEFAYKLEPQVNLDNGVAKGLFKKVLSKKLPHELLYRKKEGFNAPVQKWVTGQSTSKMRDNLLGQTSKPIMDMLNMTKLEQVVTDEQSRQNGFETIFSLYMFNRWWNANYS
jgi:asparagine synthase (glutamine-hydrolysing)